MYSEVETTGIAQWSTLLVLPPGRGVAGVAVDAGQHLAGHGGGGGGGHDLHLGDDVEHWRGFVMTDWFWQQTGVKVKCPGVTGVGGYGHGTGDGGVFWQ